MFLKYGWMLTKTRSLLWKRWEGSGFGSCGERRCRGCSPGPAGRQGLPRDGSNATSGSAACLALLFYFLFFFPSENHNVFTWIQAYYKVSLPRSMPIHHLHATYNEKTTLHISPRKKTHHKWIITTLKLPLQKVLCFCLSFLWAFVF